MLGVIGLVAAPLVYWFVRFLAVGLGRLAATLLVPAANPDARVLIVSQYVERAYAADLLADGRGGG